MDIDRIAKENCIHGIDSKGNAVYVPLFYTCSGCDGQGTQEGEFDCGICIDFRDAIDPNCRVCHGTGRVTQKVTCPDCKGAGRVVDEGNAKLIAQAIAAVQKTVYDPFRPIGGK